MRPNNPMTDNENIVEEVPSIGAPSLKAGIEAILLVVDEPVSAITLAQITNSPEIQVNKTLKMIQKEFGFDTDIYHHKRFEYCIILEEPGIYTLLFNYLYCHLIGITVNKIRNILGITTHIPIEITNTENGKEYLVTSNNGIFFWEPK